MNVFEKLTIALTVLVMAAAPASGATAQEDDPEPAGARVTAIRIAGTPAPTLDGRLDDAAWARAEVATGFVQLRPEPGAPATQRTEVRVLYDDDAIYVGMRMYEDDASLIAAQLGRRDASGMFSDWAHVLIDSYRDRRTAFRFSANPVGVKKDVLHYDDFNEDLNWDAVWEVATAIDDDGWTAEFRIPLSQLRFSPNGGSMVWGINFGREIARNAEWSWWAPVLPNSPGMVSMAGELHGLRDLTPSRRLELLPYAAAQGRSEPRSAGNPFQRSSGLGGGFDAGADLRWGITSDLTLSATINPDFGQVEADPSVVNLTAQETFYPERRPFFVEGANIFNLPIGFDDGSGEGLFYTRRVGRSPQRGLGGLGPYADAPGTTAILAAAKVSGRTAGGWSIGLVNATTAREEGSVLTWDDSLATHTVEPMTNYTVARLARDFRAGRSAVGVMATGTHRRLEGDPGLAFLADRAYTGGLDFRHRFAGEAWDLSGWLAGSHVAGEPVAIRRLQLNSLRYYQRPDAGHVEFDPDATSLSGYGGTINLWRVTGTWRGGVGGTVRSPGLDVNDAGFQTAADLKMVYGNLRYHRFEPVGPFRNFTIGINPSASWNFDGDNAHGQFNLFQSYQLQNNWSFGLWTARSTEAVSWTALRGGPAIIRPGGWRANPWFNTDSRRPVRVNGWGFLAVEDDDAGWTRNGGISVTWRPSGRLDLQAGPSVNDRMSRWQYVGQPVGAGGDRHYVFAEIRQRTVAMTTRANYTVSPNLTVQLYAQPFISAGAYDGFRIVTDPRAAAFADRFHRLGDHELTFVPPEHPGEWGHYDVDLGGAGTRDFAFGQPDFNFKELRSNLVVRWEYRPGSTLFLVWSQGRTRVDPTGVFRAADDIDALLSAPGTNVLAVKLNYWLNL